MEVIQGPIHRDSDSLIWVGPWKSDLRTTASARLESWLQPSPAWPLGFLQLSEPGSLCWKMGMVRPTWGTVVTGRGHVCKGATQCLAHGRPSINDSC